MKMNYKNITFIIIIIASIMLFFSVRQCSKNANYYADSINHISLQNDTIHYLKNGIAQKEAEAIGKDLFMKIVNERDDLKKALADAKLKAKNTQTITQVTTEIKIDTITIKLTDTLPCPDFIPIPFAIDSQYYSISGIIGKEYIKIGNVNFPDSAYIITAVKKHFFKKNEFLVSVQHTNPHIKTTGLQNFTIKEKNKWWQSGWLKFGLGIAGGIYLSQKIK